MRHSGEADDLNNFKSIKQKGNLDLTVLIHSEKRLAWDKHDIK